MPTFFKFCHPRKHQYFIITFVIFLILWSFLLKNYLFDIDFYIYWQVVFFFSQMKIAFILSLLYFFFFCNSNTLSRVWVQLNCSHWGMEQAVAHAWSLLGECPHPQGTRSSQASSLLAGHHHLAIQVIIIIFRVHTATCATATALTGASSTLVSWRESVLRAEAKKRVRIGLLYDFHH